MPDKAFVAGVGSLLVGLGINGARTGSVAGRTGSVDRAANPVWFWARIGLYVILGGLALGYALWRDD